MKRRSNDDSFEDLSVSLHAELFTIIIECVRVAMSRQYLDHFVAQSLCNRTENETIYRCRSFSIFVQSSLHKVELEDEVDLVYAVVTLPAG